MFSFAPGDDVAMAVASVRRFVDTELRDQARAHEAARAPAATAYRQARELAFALIDWPEAAGGSGLGALARCAVLEELGAGDPGAALALDPLGPAAAVLLALGGEAALCRYGLPLLEQPGARAVVVLRSALDGSQPLRCPWVPADRVDLLVLLDATGATLYRDGITLTPVHGAGLRAAGASALQVAAGAAPLARLDAPAGSDAAARALAHARLKTAALMVGQMREAADYARRYAIDRVAFGKPIAHHQALAFLIVDMHTAVDAVRLMVQETAWRCDAGQPFVAEAAAAFVEAIEAAAFVGPNAVQILGGAGFMRDYPVEKHMRELRTLGLMFGGVDAAKNDALGGLQALPDATLLSGAEPVAAMAGC